MPRGCGCGRKNRLLLLDSIGRVLVYAPDGNLEKQWWMPDYSIGRPEGIIQLKDGRYAVADTHYSRVVYFDADGKLSSMHGTRGHKPGEFIFPVSLTEDSAGNVYVAEYGAHDRVQKFSSTGKWLLEFGTFGTEDGQFQRPSGIIWIDGRVYVADAFNNRLQVFTDQGKFEQVLISSERGPALEYPYNLGRGPNGDLFIVEYGAGRITRIDLEGRLVGRFGHTGRGTGEFATPWGLTVDGAGTVYVADTGNGRIVELKP